MDEKNKGTTEGQDNGIEQAVEAQARGETPDLDASLIELKGSEDAELDTRISKGTPSKPGCGEP